MKKKFINKKEAKTLITKLGDEFAVVKNPIYIHPEFELYPLAKKIKTVDKLVAAVMDMDGTTTTTELLCIHSLEFIVRKFSGKVDIQTWKGLNPKEDYPHIIGNSTTKHVEYLITKYSKSFKKNEVIKSFLFAAAWTLIYGKDNQRKSEVVLNLKSFNCQDLISDDYFKKVINLTTLLDEDKEQLSDYLFNKYNNYFSSLGFNDYVRLGIDVYYQRYHEILERFRLGESKFIAEELFGDPHKHLIEAMPGIPVMLPMIEGLITEHHDLFFDYLLKSYQHKTDKAFSSANLEKARKNFIKLCQKFQVSPIKTAIVTSSIFYEADIVLREVFKVISNELNNLLPDSDFKRNLLQKFFDYNFYYNAVVTANDSSEIRLKPHRDLYSIALFKLNVAKEDFNKVIGFEDSESGTIAIRAAGIGLSIAVPFAETSGHNLKAATYVCKAGIPEAILKYNMFVNSK
jgi:beta-phosphoglucomutase-like phosphatase (HAD superfamily)